MVVPTTVIRSPVRRTVTDGAVASYCNEARSVAELPALSEQPNASVCAVAESGPLKVFPASQLARSIPDVASDFAVIE